MTQAEVNDTNTEAQQPSAEVENAQEPSLDSLLSEYDETPKEAPQQEPQPSAPQPTVSPDVQAFMDRQIKKEQDESIHNAAVSLREAAGQPNLSEKWFEGQLHVAANHDPRIYSAFENRDKNPGAWTSILNSLGKTIAKELTDSATDQASTDSWNAVEASVHSASTSKVTESEPNWGSMSDAEFQMAKAKFR
jgi:hypothetical protein